MYCKQCGHRSDEKTDTCTKCGARLTSEVHLSAPSKQKVRWHVVAIALVVAIVAFAVLPRFIFRAEMDSFGPTDKLRFLRALERSQYKRVGQTGFRLEGQTLIILWDLRWAALPEAKQMEIVKIEGKAWHVVGGDNTRFKIEGDDKVVAEYKDGKVIPSDN
jgi:hypothetical protein